MACARIAKKAGPDFKINQFTLKDLKCSSGTIQELLNFIVPYISENGLTEFNVQGLPKDIELESGAIRQILQQTGKLKKLCLENFSEINQQSLIELVDIVESVIHICPDTLSDLTVSGMGEEASCGERILYALCDSGLNSLKSLDLSHNTSWRAINDFPEKIVAIIQN